MTRKRRRGPRPVTTSGTRPVRARSTDTKPTAEPSGTAEAKSTPTEVPGSDTAAPTTSELPAGATVYADGTVVSVDTDADLPVADEATLASSVAHQRPGAAPAADYNPTNDYDDGHDPSNWRLIDPEQQARLDRVLGGGVG